MCLTDYIAVRTECGPSVTAVSGLYINDLPGISIKAAGEFGGDYSSGYNYLLAAIEQGYNEVKAKAFSMIDPHIKNLPFLNIDGAGQWANSEVDADDYDTAEAGFRGVEICVNQKSAANMRRIYINTIDVLTNTTDAAKTLEIVDRNTTTTKSVALTAGEVTTIPVYQQFESDKVWVRWDTTDIAPNTSTLLKSNCSTCGGGSWGGYKDYRYASVRGRKIVDATAIESKGLNRTFGIRVNFKIQCDRESIICLLRDELKYIIWKECGVRVLEGMLADSGRFNAVAMTQTEKLERGLNKLKYELYGDQEESGLKVGNRSYKGLWHEFGANAAKKLTTYDHECILCNKSRFAIQRP